MDLEELARGFGRPLRILVTRLRYLGDVILTTPVVSALRGRYPSAEIYYLTEEPYAPILEANPYLDGIVPLVPGWLSAARTAILLRRKRLTAALDLFYNPRSALLLFMSGIPVRVGGSRRWRKGLYTNNYRVPDHVRSAVSHHLHPLGIFDVGPSETLPRVHLTDPERSEGSAALERAIEGSRSGHVIAIHPGGKWQSKRWHPESFAALARECTGKLGADVLLVGGRGEEGIVRSVKGMAGGGVFILPPQGIRRLAAVLDRCSALVANDGGVMHLSVALGRPTVGIFGPTEPEIWFPYRGKGPYTLAVSGESCVPCHKHHCDDKRCLDKIGVGDVMTRLEEALRWR